MTRALDATAEAVDGPAPLSTRDFELFQRVIDQESGIFLGPGKSALLVGRISKRLRALGLRSFRAYYQHVLQDPDERVRLIEAICTHETHFFREPRHFEFLVDGLFHRWRQQALAGERARHLRLWSAGCATGEEPFSIAMLLQDHFPSVAGWDCEVLATDLSGSVLERARGGTWSIERAAEIPTPLLRRHMLRGIGSQQGCLRARPELRALIRFATLNLHGAVAPLGGPFDAIFLRNVLIYFRAAERPRVVERVIRNLRRGGHLFVGHAETLTGISGLARTGVSAVYERL